MKRVVLPLFLFGVAAVLFAQAQLPEHHFASGNWALTGQRLYQNDAGARLAKLNIQAPQSGVMLYEFEARYENGADDGHGGFGLHFFEDAPLNRASWGAGNSYLLWLNYDEHPISKDIPKGLSAQLYRSVTNARMDLVQSYDLNRYADLLTDENLAHPVRFKIVVYGDTGEIRVYDPTEDGSIYYELHINRRDLPLKGDWVSLRTNGMSLSFAN
jgi:hypothetical protein